MIDFNSNSAFTNVYLGSFQLSRMYVGDNQVWPETTPPSPTGYSTQYLTFTATANNRFKFAYTYDKISYSLDSGSTWTSISGTNAYTPVVNAGDKIMWKGTTKSQSNLGIGYFSSTAQFTVEGNVMSLIYGDDFVNETDLTGKDYYFRSLFSGCTGLTSAENLVLPATTLSESCYDSMFRGCTSLASAPVLPAATLITYCYYRMFYGCSNLNSVTCLATDISAGSCTNNWLNSVSATGTFTKAASMTGWGTGASGIPSGWTVQDAS